MVLLLMGAAAIVDRSGSGRKTPQVKSRPGPAHALHHLRVRPFQ
jgi:hypothetical protein